MVHTLKGYKTLSVTQLVNVFVAIIHNLDSFDAFRLLCGYLFLEAKQEATERSLKKRGHAVKDWDGLTVAELRKWIGGRRSVSEMKQSLVDLGIASIRNKRITITETPLPESRPFLTLICGNNGSGGYRRSITRPVPVPHEWLKEWAKPTRAKLVPLLHLFYCAACLAFKNGTTGEVKCAATFKFAQLIALSCFHRSRMTQARKRLIDEKRISPDTTRFQRKLNRDGHYASVNFGWCRVLEKLENRPPRAKNCTEMRPPYRDNKQSLIVGRNQKALGVFSKQVSLSPKPNKVKASDLWSVERLHDLYKRQHWMEKTKPGFLFFVTCAVKARKCGRNPVGLFVWLIRGKKWEYVTNTHEDLALKEIAKFRERIYHQRRLQTKAEQLAA